MTISGADRHALHDYFISQMDERLAGELMQELIHEVDWGEFATKHDLHVEIADVRHDVAALRQDVRSLELRFDDKLDAAKAELRTEIAHLRTELRTEIGGLRSEMHQGFRRITVWTASLQTVTFGALVAVALRMG